MTTLDVDYRRFLDCVHCGLCASSCPTFLETGDENDSPRGRIHLMRAVADGRLELEGDVRRHLDLCLGCRACETACPSGVQYGHLIEAFREAVAPEARGDWLRDSVLLGTLTDPARAGRAVTAGRLAERLGLLDVAEASGLVRLLPPRLRALVETRPEPQAYPPLPAVVPAEGRRRARVALWLGCVADSALRGTHWATARVLAKNGVEVVVPHAAGGPHAGSAQCCGALHHHAGERQTALSMLDASRAAIDPDDVDAIVVDVAGCGAFLKEAGDLTDDAQAGERSRFAAKVKDPCELLDELGVVAALPRLEAVATYHDACHLVHAQRIREAPRRLLSAIPGLELRELAESEVCCGAAGSYAVLQPEMSKRLGRRKLQHVAATGAEIVVTANAGCILQMRREARRCGLEAWVAHPMEVLERAYRNA